MSTATKIEWTDATWNPTTGCTRVSAGCEHCYIERTPPMRVNRRFEGPHIGASTKGGVQLHPDRLDQPLHWRKPRRVFVNSMSDLFHPDVPDYFVADVFIRMALASQHVFQVLTKRPRHMLRALTSGTFRHAYEEGFRVAGKPIPDEWPLPNVWLGTSVENQEWAYKRVPLLCETPAAVRFLSCEPLLGPLAIGGWLGEFTESEKFRSDVAGGIDWVIVGGESGPGARPMHPSWARSLRDQCVAAGVPFFFKQWGEWTSDRSGQHRVSKHRSRYAVAIVGPNGEEYQPQGDSPDWWGQGAFMYRKGKKAAGRELDGRTWDEMPEGVPA